MTTRIIDAYLGSIRTQFGKTERKAQQIINKDQQKAIGTLRSAWLKARFRKDELENIWIHLKLLFGLIDDYIKGAYTEIPYRSVVAILSGILYFVSPIDAIPDFILGFGLIDDVFILSLIIKQLESDLRKYTYWKELH